MSPSPTSDLPHASLAERYRVLLDIGRTLTGTLSTRELYRAIHQETARVLEAEGFYISLYDPELDLATVVFYADRGKEEEVSIRYPGSRSDVIRTGEPSRVEDRLARRSVVVLGDDSDGVTRSAISAPLRVKGKVVGAISTQSYRAHAYGPGDLELLQGIADVAAIALENARFVAELQRRRLESDRIEEIGRTLIRSRRAEEVLGQVASAARELLDTDSATVWLLEMDEGATEGTVQVGASTGELKLPGGADSFPVSGPILDELVGKQQPIQVDDVASSAYVPELIRDVLSARSGIIVPMILGDRVAGAVSAGTVAPRAFTGDEVRLLQRLAGQGSVALENARLHQRLEALSLTDPLTGLPNRRHLQAELEREVSAAQRGRALSVVLFDLDNFKAYNDTLGHPAGDEALRAMAGILYGESRAMNLVARYGGDEFVSVLADTDVEGALKHAARVAAAVAMHPLLAPHGVTVSFGVGSYGADVGSGEALIRKADEALYASKGTRVVR